MVFSTVAFRQIQLLLEFKITENEYLVLQNKTIMK
jgi:hypothetical protein